MARLFTGLIVLVLAIIAALVATFAFFRVTIPDEEIGRDVFVASANNFSDAISKSSLDFDETRRNKFYPSLSVSVYHNGRHLWSEVNGYADIKEKTPASFQTLYPIGSVSKSLTAALTMKLASQGLVNIDAPIGDYTTTLPSAYQSLTLRQLLSHQAGVRHYRFTIKTPPVFTENGLNKEFSNTEDALSIFVDDPLLFEADSDFSYSTFGYTVVSFILEEVTGRPFTDIMETELLRPLGLTRTQPDFQSNRRAARSSDYIAAMRKLGLVPSPASNSSYKYAGGGYLSTTDDLASFGDALLRGEILDDDAMMTMFTARTLPSGEANPQQYGLGWRIGGMYYPRGSENIQTIYHHGGTAAGSECALLLSPDSGLTVAACGNAFTGGSQTLISLSADIVRNFQDTLALQ